MTAGIAEILNGYSLKAVLRRVPGEKHTRAAEDTHDDSYLGNMHLQNKNNRTLHYIRHMQLTHSVVYRVNFTHMSSCATNFSLGYSVAVGEFTGDSEQGEKANNSLQLTTCGAR